MAVVVKEDSLAAGIAPAGEAELLNLVHSRVELQLVPRSRLPAFVLRLKGFPDHLDRLGRCHRQRLHPALFPRAGRRLYYVWRVHPDVQAQHERYRNSLHAVLGAPFLHEARVVRSTGRRIVSSVVALGVREEHALARLKVSIRPVESMQPAPRPGHARRASGGTRAARAAIAAATAAELVRQSTRWTHRAGAQTGAARTRAAAR